MSESEQQSVTQLMCCLKRIHFSEKTVLKTLIKLSSICTLLEHICRSVQDKNSFLNYYILINVVTIFYIYVSKLCREPVVVWSESRK